MMLSSSRFSQAPARLVHAGAVLVAGLLVSGFVAGCGAGYRPVISPINPSGPATQVSGLVATVSYPSQSAPGVATIIDYSGDTVMARSPIGPGPTTFSVDQSGSNGYTVNSDGTLTNFNVSTQLQQKNVEYSTLPTTARLVNTFTPSAGMWAADLDGNVIDVLSGFPQTFKLAVPVAKTPVTVMGPGRIGQRNYAISQNFADPTGVACNTAPRSAPASGQADAIETATFTVSASISLGMCPVYAVESPDSKRLFVLNRGDDTITVINSQNNTLDSCVCPPTGCVNQSGQSYFCHPTLPLSLSAVSTINASPACQGSTAPPCGGPPNGTTGMTSIAGPVYAEFNSNTNLLAIADYDGGTISVIDVSLDLYGNDSPTFGTTFTIPVGANPASVTVLDDGSRAYAANQADSTVSVVSLSSHTPLKTLPVNGHPRTVVSTQNSLYGKIYVASPDSPYLTILRTDQDIVDATVLVQGDVVDVRVSTQNGSNGNANVVSRTPGFGQPCYLPPALVSNATLATNPAACSTMP